MTTFSKRLKNLRKEEGLTGEELGKIFNVTKTAISYWENSKTFPDELTLKRMAEFFDVSLDYLLGRTDAKNRDKKELPIEFTTPEEAMKFILEQNVIMGFGGFDVNKMSDDEVMEFANELLNQLKLLGYKYKK